MKVFYSDTFKFPLPESHHFPASKYRRLREYLISQSWSVRLELLEAPDITDQQLKLVHNEEYLNKIFQGKLSRIEMRKIGFPWSEEMVIRHRRSNGATLAASRAALRDNAGVHLAGGTHHAFPDRGEGFCVFNDVAVSIRTLQYDRLINQAVIIDLDVHQGNGTAAIFDDDDRVFTFSMHGERNFPENKTGSDLDVQLPDETGDHEYLQTLETILSDDLPLNYTDMVFYIAGADCFEHDRYGRISLTKAGLSERDRLVINACKENSLPVCMVMGGGYAKRIQDIVDINAMSVQNLLEHANS